MNFRTDAPLGRSLGCREVPALCVTHTTHEALLLRPAHLQTWVSHRRRRIRGCERACAATRRSCRTWNEYTACACYGNRAGCGWFALFVEPGLPESPLQALTVICLRGGGCVRGVAAVVPGPRLPACRRGWAGRSSHVPCTTRRATRRWARCGGTKVQMPKCRCFSGVGWVPLLCGAPRDSLVPPRRVHSRVRTRAVPQSGLWSLSGRWTSGRKQRNAFSPHVNSTCCGCTSLTSLTA